MTKTAVLREATAYHEAGHAVAAIVLHGTFRYVTIEPTEGALGHVMPHPWGKQFRPDLEVTDRMRTRLESHILTLLAGMHAEKLCTGRWNPSGAASDFHQAHHLALYLSGSDEAVQAHLLWLSVRATDLVCDPLNWAAIQALAAKLLQQPRLTACEAREVVTDAHRRQADLPWDDAEVTARRNRLVPRHLRRMVTLTPKDLAQMTRPPSKSSAGRRRAES
jgi:hypothetical protein